MTVQDSQAAFDAIQMGLIYSEEIGDEQARQELKIELEHLLTQSPCLASKASAVLSKFFPC